MSKAMAIPSKPPYDPPMVSPDFGYSPVGTLCAMSLAFALAGLLVLITPF
ncbi:MAG TPA: hypothetical protein VM240_03195 [Verrucomicrobiae bacterium]|nr:hypothetical protein [Verrucomicrobiae bacterium]